MTDRREFLKRTGAAAPVLAADGALGRAGAALAGEPQQAAMDAAPRDLLMAALNAARMAGAGYADVRIERQRQNFVFTREQQILNVVDTDTIGCGVRVLVDGTWGFAVTRRLTRDAVAEAAGLRTTWLRSRAASTHRAPASPAPA